MADVLMKGLGFRGAVAGLPGSGHDDGEVGGLETGIHLVGASDAAQQEGGGNEEKKRDGDLADEECVREVDCAATAPGGADILLQRFGDRRGWRGRQAC